MISDGKNAELRFVNHAKSLGYSKKVVGDNAYTMPNGNGYIKLWGARSGKLQVYLEGRGRYEIQYR